VSEIEWKCHFALSLKDNKCVLKCLLAVTHNWGLNGNVLYSVDREQQVPEDEKCLIEWSEGKRGVHKNCLWRMESNGRALIETE
jgi:hypothetical protein